MVRFLTLAIVTAAGEASSWGEGSGESGAREAK